ncbi:dihydrofolate reductase family protein [Leptospira sp. GIMC2001]|uniref:dihydrofolate reductase family protein n=1 Tax=Leptospira sp. GIMC2001 TaxID=1513297 RepID=UPI00234B3D28|nr:dihydrofolate reductase family protein [Leptospira sp. GIMC2001]WCL50353.1 dihydrofolate reductase family protein [Leptospira sp. GIMC2001]
MRKVIFAINCTADGFYGHENMLPDESVHNFFTKLLSSAGCILYGRITFQLMIPYWPEIAKNQNEDASSNEFAKTFDSVHKILFSRSLQKINESNSVLAQNNLVDEVLSLKKQPGKDIYIGSLSLASQLTEQELIDEYYFVVHPVIAGQGPKLFNQTSMQNNLLLDLIGSEKFPSGAIALHYKKRI